MLELLANLRGSALAEILLERDARPVVAAALVGRRRAREVTRIRSHVQLGRKHAVPARAARHVFVVRPRCLAAILRALAFLIEALDGDEFVGERPAVLQPVDRVAAERIQVDAVLVGEADRLAVGAENENDAADNQHDRLEDRRARLLVEERVGHEVQTPAAPFAAAVLIAAAVVAVRVVVRVHVQHPRRIGRRHRLEVRIPDEDLPGFDRVVPIDREDAVRRATEVVVLRDAHHRIGAGEERRAARVEDGDRIVRLAREELADEPPEGGRAHLVLMLDVELVPDVLPHLKAIDRQAQDAAVLLAVDRLERHAEAVAVLGQPLDNQLVEESPRASRSGSHHSVSLSTSRNALAYCCQEIESVPLFRTPHHFCASVRSASSTRGETDQVMELMLSKLPLLKRPEGLSRTPHAFAMLRVYENSPRWSSSSGQSLSQMSRLNVMTRFGLFGTMPDGPRSKVLLTV